MFYILHGQEDLTRTEEVAKLKRQIMNDGMGDLNITQLDGRRLELSELINVCNTLPFFTQRRLIIVQDLLQRFESGGGRRRGQKQPADSTADKEYAKKLAAYLPSLPPTTRLLFIESRSLGRRNPIVHLANDKEIGYIREFKPLKEGQVSVWIQRRVKSKGVDIARDAVALLVTYVGTDLRLLDQELEKLAAYAGYGRAITAEDVRQLVNAALDANIFAMVDSIGMRDRAHAMAQLEELIADGANELYLLAMIARQVRLILSAKDLAENQGMRANEIRVKLKISHGFIVEKLLRQAKQFEMRELETIMQRLLTIDEEIKTGRVDGMLALEVLIVQACRRPASRQRVQRRARSRTN